MALLEIPTQNNLPVFQESVEIEGVLYNLFFYFNRRQNLWFLDFLDLDEQPIYVGIPLQSGIDLTPYARHLSIPKGLFLAFDSLGLNKDAEEDNLGERVRMLYEESNNA